MKWIKIEPNVKLPRQYEVCLLHINRGGYTETSRGFLDKNNNWLSCGNKKYQNHEITHFAIITKPIKLNQVKYYAQVDMPRGYGREVE